MKNRRWMLALAVLLIVILGTVFFAKDNSATSACGSYRPDKTVEVGRQKLKAEVASTEAQQAKGLSGRPCIGKNQAMLFVFNAPGFYRIWMKDMKFPIDIIWVGADHKTVGVERDVEPSTYPSTFRNKDDPALYVIEMQSNRSSSLGITLGTQISF